MPGPRTPFRLAHRDSLQLSGIPRLSSLIPDWWADARCAQEPDPDLTHKAYFQELPLQRQLDERPGLSSPLTMLGVLLCSLCPVRRACLLAALDPPEWAAREDDLGTLGRQERTHRTFGVWAGSTEFERHLLKDLAPEDAADALENTFDERYKRREAAYWRLRKELRPDPNRPGKLRTRPRTKADKRIDEILAARALAKKKAQVGVDPHADARNRVTATASLPATSTRCERCSTRLDWRKRSDARWCSNACRQAAWRRLKSAA